MVSILTPQFCSVYSKRTSLFLIDFYGETYDINEIVWMSFSSFYLNLPAVFKLRPCSSLAWLSIRVQIDICEWGCSNEFAIEARCAFIAAFSFYPSQPETPFTKKLYSFIWFPPRERSQFLPRKYLKCAHNMSLTCYYILRHCIYLVLQLYKKYLKKSWTTCTEVCT